MPIWKPSNSLALTNSIQLDYLLLSPQMDAEAFAVKGLILTFSEILEVKLALLRKYIEEKSSLVVIYGPFYALQFMLPCIFTVL